MTLKLNGSSSGSVSIDAPASTTSGADITFALPVADGTANQVLTTNASGQLQWKTLPFTEFDIWRKTADTTGNSDPLTDIERADTGGFEKIGTGMSHSSGIFTFPSTGKWYLTFHMAVNNSSSGDNCTAQIATTVDNGSNWVAAAANTCNPEGAAQGQHDTAHTSFLFDVTDTAQRKVKFVCTSILSSTTVRGNTDESQTYMEFMRVGDT